jgi:hypothetical protein
MHPRSITPSPGFRFWAHRAVVEQGVRQVEYEVAKHREDGETVDDDYDPVLVTLHAQAHALFRIRVAGEA